MAATRYNPDYIPKRVISEKGNYDSNVCAVWSEKPKKTLLANPFEMEGNWYKTNLHTHTTVSDGDVNVPDRVAQYRNLGYNVLAITDHDKATDVGKYSDANILVLNGAEMTLPSHSENPYHLLCLNVPDNFQKSTATLNIQHVIDLVDSLGGVTIVAHPYLSGFNINDLLAIKGYCGIEIFNGQSVKANKEYDLVHWDDLLMCGHPTGGFAGDDIHDSNDIQRGWVIIKAKKLSAESVIDSLRKGSFYASCGPEIKDFGLASNAIFAKSSPVKKIQFVSNGTGKTITAPENQFITEGQYDLRPFTRFVRVVITDANGKMAWTNPIWINRDPNTQSN